MIPVETQHCRHPISIDFVPSCAQNSSSESNSNPKRWEAGNYGNLEMEDKNCGAVASYGSSYVSPQHNGIFGARYDRGTNVRGVGRGSINIWHFVQHLASPVQILIVGSSVLTTALIDWYAWKWPKQES